MLRTHGRLGVHHDDNDGQAKRGALCFLGTLARARTSIRDIRAAFWGFGWTELFLLRHDLSWAWIVYLCGWFSYLTFTLGEGLYGQGVVALRTLRCEVDLEAECPGRRETDYGDDSLGG